MTPRCISEEWDRQPGLVVARDGVEALDYLFARQKHAGRDPNAMPQVILLDLKLPKLDGLEVLRTLRDDDRTKLLPVVVMTSSREEQDLVRSYDLGANSYVRKPVDFAQFVEAVRQLGPVLARPERGCARPRLMRGRTALGAVGQGSLRRSLLARFIAAAYRSTPEEYWTCQWRRRSIMDQDGRRADAASHPLGMRASVTNLGGQGHGDATGTDCNRCPQRAARRVGSRAIRAATSGLEAVRPNHGGL